MDRNKIAAVLCAIIAFLLVVMAGKSCSARINETNEANRNKATQSAETTAESRSDTAQGEKTSPPANVQYDLFGRPIIPTEAPAEEIQPVTDEDGNVIEPEIEAVTDESGNILETTLPDGEESGENAEEPTEAVDQPPTAPPGLSGFDHKEYDRDGNEVATIPPDFVIVIE